MQLELNWPIQKPPIYTLINDKMGHHYVHEPIYRALAQSIRLRAVHGRISPAWLGQTIKVAWGPEFRY
jgi:hypothetical protein